MTPPDAVGISAFALEGGVVFQTYSAYGRGVDALWAMYPWLDRAPKGRNETDRWYHLHDEFEHVVPAHDNKHADDQGRHPAPPAPQGDRPRWSTTPAPRSAPRPRTCRSTTCGPCSRPTSRRCSRSRSSSGRP